MSREATIAFFAAFVLFVTTARGLTLGDEAVHLDLALAMLRGETRLDVDPGEHWVSTRPIAGGLFYQDDRGLRAASSPGHALLSLPLVGIGALLSRGPISFDAFFASPPSPRSIIRPLARDPRVIAFALVGPLCGALSVALVVLAGGELGFSRSARIASAAALALGSPLLSYAGTCWTQLPTTAALSLVLYGLAARQMRSSARMWPIALGASVALFVRPEHLLPIAIAIAALYFIERGFRRSPSRALARVLVSLLVASALLAWWSVPFGNEGVSLAQLPVGFAGLLVSPRTGILVYAPFALLVPLGIARLWSRARPFACVLFAWPIAALIQYGGWFDWSASLAYGPRFLVPILPALALALGAAFDAFPRARVAAIATIGVGFFVELPGALLAHLRIEEPERFFSPTFASAWRLLLGGREAIGELGTDCASTYVPSYWLVAVTAGALGAFCYWATRNESKT